MASPSAESIRASNWAGFVPVVLSLAPTSLSSPTIPPPIHVMVSRQCYLHLALQTAVRRLHRFAPAMLSLPSSVRNEPDPGENTQENNEDDEQGVVGSDAKGGQEQKYPVCWFEDDHSGTPLRWHLFAGVLWDTRSTNNIPWRLRLHFNNYPSHEILPLQDKNDSVLTIVERTYKNALKQALFMQTGFNKTAMNMTKQSHEKVWDSVMNSKYQLYREVNGDLMTATNQLPIRLLVNYSVLQTLVA